MNRARQGVTRGNHGLRREFLTIAGMGLAAALPILATHPDCRGGEAKSSPRSMNIEDFGAVGDGVTVNTKPIQQAIDACAGRGGGLVYVPPGKFLTGGIELRNHVYLELAPGATLLGSTDRADYRKVHGDEALVLNIYDSPVNKDEYLIFARGASNVGILGRGTVHAQGVAFYDTKRTRPTGKYKPGGVEYRLKEWRPGPTIAFFDCEQVRIEGITLRDNPSLGVHLNRCTHAWLSGIRIQTNPAFISIDDSPSARSTSVRCIPVMVASSRLLRARTG